MNIETKEDFYNYIGDQQKLMHTQILEDYFKPLMYFLYSRKREQELSRQASIESGVPAF
jgi:hypothetical protein